MRAEPTHSVDDYVRLTKVREFPGSSRDVEKEAFTGATSEGAPVHRLEIGYAVDGWFLHGPRVGERMILLRCRRNGIQRFGLFTSSLVTLVGKTEIHTENSVYRLEHGDMSVGPQSGAIE